MDFFNSEFYKNSLKTNSIIYLWKFEKILFPKLKLTSDGNNIN